MPRRHDLLTVPQATRLQQLVLNFPDVPHRVRMAIVGTVERETETGTGGWGFMMVDMFRVRAMRKWLRLNAKRSVKTSELWDLCLELADRFDGEVPIDRPKMAAEMETSVRDLGRMLSDLARCNALLRERDGRFFRYRVNPRVATNLPLEPREIAQRAAPEIAGVSNRYPFTELRAVA
jgi:hypothetical protein